MTLKDAVYLLISSHQCGPDNGRVEGPPLKRISYLNKPAYTPAALTVLFKESSSHLSEGPPGIGSQTFGRLVSDLDTVL